VKSLKEQLIFQGFHTLPMQQVSRAAPVHQCLFFSVADYHLTSPYVMAGGGHG